MKTNFVRHPLRDRDGAGAGAEAMDELDLSRSPGLAKLPLPPRHSDFGAGPEGAAGAAGAAGALELLSALALA